VNIKILSGQIYGIVNYTTLTIWVLLGFCETPAGVDEFLSYCLTQIKITRSIGCNLTTLCTPNFIIGIYLFIAYIKKDYN